jgi:hypothetical protein
MKCDASAFSGMPDPSRSRAPTDSPPCRYMSNVD